jgi:hypothetical protein
MVMSPRVRSFFVLLVGGAALAFAADVVVRTPGFLVPRDFLEYWAAGRVNLRGGNPYHPDELLAEQKHADPGREHAVMMWNPPPSLAVYMPLGALPPRWATLLWVGLQLAAVFVACDLLWRTYCPTHRWLAAVVAISFAGTWWLVAYGQNTGFMLLGLAGFLHFTRREQSLAAGACAALTALKPHLLGVFGVLLVADALARRGRVSLASGVTVILVALGVALAANPHVVAQFVETVRNPAAGAVPLSEWTLPVPAYWLRVAVAPGQFWVQFVPCALACAGFVAWRWWKQEGVGGRTRGGFPLPERAAWDWARVLPLVVVTSVLTTPYGGWVFDLPVLLVPVVWAAARLASEKKWALAALVVLVQAGVTAATFARPGALHDYWWVAPAALLPCLLAVGRAPRS